MCIIIHKPWDVKLPSKETIQICWDNNDDGAGFMVLRHKSTEVEYHKGFMTLEALNSALSEANVREEDSAAYHFRIATSGGVNPDMTHPFEVSKKDEALRRLHGKAHRVFMHNGIIGKGTKELSDTALYVKETVACIKSIEKEQEKIAKDTKGSRTLTFDSREGVLETGGWEVKDGIKYSNGTYMYNMYRSYNAYSGGMWGGRSWKHEDDYEDDWRSYRAPLYPQGKYYKLTDLQEGWSDECYDEKGCGYGYSGSMYCTGCEFANICDRGLELVKNGTFNQLCEAGVDIAFRDWKACNICRNGKGCYQKAFQRYSKNSEWIHGKGYCIRVF